MIQLDLFEEPRTEHDVLWEAFASLKESHRSTQKRLFAELSDVKERLIELSAEMERMKRMNWHYSSLLDD